MGFAAAVVCDSIASGVRLTTMVVTFPRIVLAEFNTHRVFSRNSASSRAIPVERRIEQVERDPFVPAVFAGNKPGMQAGDALEDQADRIARLDWLAAARSAVDHARLLAARGVHKQWANRLLEPFAWHTVVVSATEWDNFWALRCHPDAQPEMQTIANIMRAEYRASTPQVCDVGDWHLPFVDPEEHIESIDSVRVSVARAAAVSYERHLKRDVPADLARYEKLRLSGHMSPFEHAAFVGHEVGGFLGNFRRPWIQHRKQIPGEKVFGDATASGLAS